MISSIYISLTYYSNLKIYFYISSMGHISYIFVSFVSFKDYYKAFYIWCVIFNFIFSIEKTISNIFFRFSVFIFYDAMLPKSKKPSNTFEMFNVAIPEPILKTS